MDANGADEKGRAAWMSVLAALVLTGVKLAVGMHTNSLGILSEALHSGLDLLAALMTLLAVRVAARPADASHPFGHGKVENLSALAETLLLLVTCFWVANEAMLRLLEGGEPVIPSVWGMAVMAFSMALDINRVRMLRRVAKKHGSQALEADALHFATDIFSSLAVLLGVAAVWAVDVFDIRGDAARILVQADSAAALLVAALILHAALRMARDSVNILMDAGSERDQDSIRARAEQVPGILAVRRVRQRVSGPCMFVELSVGVDPHIRVEDGHGLADRVETAVRELFPGADVVVHVEPMEADLDAGDLVTGVIRLAGRRSLSVHDVRILQAEEGRVVEMHVALPDDEDFLLAHERVTLLENDVRKRPGVCGVMVLMEPEGVQARARTLTDDAGDPVVGALRDAAERLVADEPLAEGLHNLTVYTSALDGLCLGFRCRFVAGLSVRDAYTVIRRMERELLSLMPMLERVIIRMDPPKRMHA